MRRVTNRAAHLSVPIHIQRNVNTRTLYYLTMFFFFNKTSVPYNHTYFRGIIPLALQRKLERVLLLPMWIRCKRQIFFLKAEQISGLSHATSPPYLWVSWWESQGSTRAASPGSKTSCGNSTWSTVAMLGFLFCIYCIIMKKRSCQLGVITYDIFLWNKVCMRETQFIWN